MKKIISVISVLVAVGFLALVIQPGLALDPSWKLVIKMAGTVETQKQGQTTWDSIWNSRMMSDGDKAKTLTDSRAKIKLADQSIIVIGSNSLVELSQFKLSPTDRIAKFNLLVGKMRSKVEKFMGGNSSFEVTTPNCVIAARGTEFYVEQQAVAMQQGVQGLSNNYVASVPDLGGATKIIAFFGDLLVTSRIESYVVPEGSTAIIDQKGSIYINPTNFQFPGGPASPNIKDGDLSDPLTSVSEQREQLSPPQGPPPEPPMFNPGVTPQVPHSGPYG